MTFKVEMYAHIGQPQHRPGTQPDFHSNTIRASTTLYQPMSHSITEGRAYSIAACALAALPLHQWVRGAAWSAIDSKDGEEQCCGEGKVLHGGRLSLWISCLKGDGIDGYPMDETT
jgi:hypothetical protein